MADLANAFTTAGKLLESSDVTRTVTGRVRYGLQRIKLRVSVHDHGDGTSVLHVHAFGDDVWGGGARKGTDKLLQALNSVAR